MVLPGHARHVAELGQLLGDRWCRRDDGIASVVAHVALADIELLLEARGIETFTTLHLELVRELPLFRQGLCLAVHEQLAMRHADTITGNGNTSLDVVLLLVHRPHQQSARRQHHRPAFLVLGLDAVERIRQLFAAMLAHQLVVALVLEVRHHGIALGEVEDHGIATLWRSKAGQAPVGLAEPGGERRRAGGQRHRVVREGKGDRRHRQARTVAELAHEEVVAHEQTLLHGGRWDRERLEGVCAEDRGHDHGEEDGIAPLAQHAAFAFSNGDRSDVGFVRVTELRDLPPRQQHHQEVVLHRTLLQYDADVHVHDDEHEQVHARYDEEEDPPPRFSRDLEPDQEVVSRNEACPSWFARLLEQFPQACEENREVGVQEEVGDHGIG